MTKMVKIEGKDFKEDVCSEVQDNSISSLACAPSMIIGHSVI